MEDKIKPATSGDIYNPFEHRAVEKPNSDIRSTANLIKSSLGSGLLAVPLAFSNAGWGVGIVGTLVIGFICGHCVHMLVNTSRTCCVLEKKPLLDYSETCRATFVHGPKEVRKYAFAAMMFAEVSMFLTYVGVCCVYTILISDSVKQLIDRYYPIMILPVEYYCLIILVPLALMSQIRHLKWLAPLSLTANILLVATFLICLYYIFGGEISYADKRVYSDPARFPAFLSTVIFAMEGIGVVMPVENVMKKPEHFLGCPSVLVISMGIIMFLYSTLGLFGYFRFGDVLRGSITLNLPMDDWPAIVAKILISVSIFLTFPLQFFVVIDIFNKYTAKYISDKYKTTTQIVARSLGVCLCVGIGIALPMLEQIINFVGAFFYSILGLLIPSTIDTVIRWDSLGRYNWIFWKNATIFIIGFGSLVSGCTVAIMDMIEISNQKME